MSVSVGDAYFDDVVITRTPTNIIQYNEYYPFGLNTESSWTRENVTGNNFQYNESTEQNPTTGYYDLFFRNFDPTLGRFMQVDPLASLYHNQSTYQYGNNDPVYFTDPSGAGGDERIGSPRRYSVYNQVHDRMMFGSLETHGREGQAWDQSGPGGLGTGMTYTSFEGGSFVAAKAAEEKRAQQRLQTLGVAGEMQAYGIQHGKTVMSLWFMTYGTRNKDGGVDVNRAEIELVLGDEVHVIQASLAPQLTVDEAMNLADSFLLMAEGFLLREEHKANKIIKNKQITGSRHMYKAGLGTTRALGVVTGAAGAGLSMMEAKDRGSKGAYTLAAMDATVAALTIAFPALAPFTILYGATRLAMELNGYKADEWIDEKLFNE